MSKKIGSLKDLYDHKLISIEDTKTLQPVLEKFSLAITQHMHAQIDMNDKNDPIAMQFVPNAKELNILPQEKADPIGDDSHMTVKGLIHRYPDRCLLTPVHVCPVYCRFCFRREKVGAGSKVMLEEELNLAYEYINKHKELWEVILTGGDPLILNPKKLNQILEKLSAIKHIGVIRIHTRIPIVDPSRINIEMLKAFQKSIPVYIVIHSNHPKEFTLESINACKDLINYGVPLLSQSVLLKGINDDIDTLSELMKCFIKNKIKPYYLHQGDLAQGTQHFRTSIRTGQKLMKQLRGRFSGICQPTYMLDIPGGYGKSPIGPNYLKLVTKENCTEYIVEDYNGIEHEYNEFIN